MDCCVFTGSAACVSTMAINSVKRFSALSRSSVDGGVANKKRAGKSITSNTSLRISQALFSCVPFQSQLNQPVNQLWHSESRILPHLRVHAYGREPGNGVDLVDIELIRRGFEQKIHARHPLALYRLIAFDGQPLHL